MTAMRSSGVTPCLCRRVNTLYKVVEKYAGKTPRCSSTERTSATDDTRVSIDFIVIAISICGDRRNKCVQLITRCKEYYAKDPGYLKCLYEKVFQAVFKCLLFSPHCIRINKTQSHRSKGSIRRRNNTCTHKPPTSYLADH